MHLGEVRLARPFPPPDATPRTRHSSPRCCVHMAKVCHKRGLRVVYEKQLSRVRSSSISRISLGHGGRPFGAFIITITISFSPMFSKVFDMYKILFLKVCIDAHLFGNDSIQEIRVP